MATIPELRASAQVKLSAMLTTFQELPDRPSHLEIAADVVDAIATYAEARMIDRMHVVLNAYAARRP